MSHESKIVQIFVAPVVITPGGKEEYRAFALTESGSVEALFFREKDGFITMSRSPV